MNKCFNIALSFLFLTTQSNSMLIKKNNKSGTRTLKTVSFMLDPDNSLDSGFKVLNYGKKKTGFNVSKPRHTTHNSIGSSEKKNISIECSLRLNNNNKQEVLVLSVYDSSIETDHFELVLRQDSLLALSNSEAVFYTLKSEGYEENIFTAKKRINTIVEDISALYFKFCAKKNSNNSVFTVLTSLFKKKKSVGIVYKKCFYPKFYLKSKDESFNDFSKEVLKKFDDIMELYKK